MLAAILIVIMIGLQTGVMLLDFNVASVYSQGGGR